MVLTIWLDNKLYPIRPNDPIWPNESYILFNDKKPSPSQLVKWRVHPNSEILKRSKGYFVWDQDLQEYGFGQITYQANVSFTGVQYALNTLNLNFNLIQRYNKYLPCQKVSSSKLNWKRCIILGRSCKAILLYITNSLDGRSLM